MEFYNPNVTFKGNVLADNAPTLDGHLVRKQDVSGLSFINAIASGSSSMLSVADGELSISSLAITDVHVDNTQTSLANFVANESSTAASLKEGDVLVLTAPSDGTETYIVSGADGSSTSNYTQIESPITAAEIGAVLSAGDGISINSSTAQISANLAAGTGLSSSVSNGQITFALNADTDDVAEGTSNLYYTDARVRAAVSSGSQSDELINYDSSNGSFSLRLSDLRYETTVTLSANTPATITHNLGVKLVHVSAMDSSGNLIHLDVVYSSTSALTVESVSGVSVTIAVSV